MNHEIKVKKFIFQAPTHEPVKEVGDAPKPGSCGRCKICQCAKPKEAPPC